MKKIAIILLIVIAATCLFVLPVQEYLTTFLEWIQDIGPAGPFLLIGVYILACIFFIPGSILTLGAGFAFGLTIGTITVSMASILGASVAFLLGRTLLRDWVEKKVSDNPKFNAIDRAVAKQGFKIVLLIRLSPAFPFNLLNYMFGLTNVSFWKHFFGSWIGMLPGTVMYVYFGSAIKSVADLAAGNYERGIGQWLLIGVGLIATIAVTVLVTRIAKKALDEAAPGATTEFVSTTDSPST